MIEGEILSVFFAEFFLKTVPPHFAVFQSSVCLRFLSEGFRNELWNGSPVFFLGGGFLSQKCPFCVPKTAKRKVIPVLGFFWSFIFLMARFYGGFGQRAPCFVMTVFSLVLGVRFCLVLFM